MSKKVKYTIATIATLFVGYHTIFCSLVPEWYWLLICLSAIWGTFCFAIAEKSYHFGPDFSFKKYPMTFIFASITVISEILAIIQIILIMRNRTF